jgi:hypothetical protein
MMTMAKWTGILVASAMLFAPMPATAQRSPVDALRLALDELDGSIAAIERMKSSRQKDRALRRAIAARALLADGLDGLAGRVAPGPGPRPHRDTPVMVPAAPSPMDPARFDDLLLRLGALTFSKDQMNYLADVVREHYFTTEQVRRVMRVFTFDSEKVKAAVVMYPAVLDRKDFYRAQDELTFESDRERLRAEVRRIDATGLPRGVDGR